MQKNENLLETLFLMSVNWTLIVDLKATVHPALSFTPWLYFMPCCYFRTLPASRYSSSTKSLLFYVHCTHSCCSCISWDQAYFGSQLPLALLQIVYVSVLCTAPHRGSTWILLTNKCVKTHSPSSHSTRLLRSRWVDAAAPFCTSHFQQESASALLSSVCTAVSILLVSFL